MIVQNHKEGKVYTMTGENAINENKLGEYFRTIREARGLSLKDVAVEIELSASYINRLENGNRSNPTIDAVNRLSSFYGVSFETVMKLAGFNVDKGVELTSQDLGLFIDNSKSIVINGILVSKDLFKELVDKCITVDVDKFADVMDLFRILKELQATLNGEANLK